MSKRPVVIQINSLEAIERLIGNDTQVEVDLRQSIAVAFANRYLKPLAESPLFLIACQEARAGIDKAFGELVAKNGAEIVKSSLDPKGFYIRLPPNVSKTIEFEVNRQVRDRINDAINEQMSQQQIILAPRIRAEVERVITETMVNEVQKTLKKIMKEKAE